jgi:hypothetical protein
MWLSGLSRFPRGHYANPSRPSPLCDTQGKLSRLAL